MGIFVVEVNIANFSFRANVELISRKQYQDIALRELFDPKFTGALHISSDLLTMYASYTSGYILDRKLEDRLNVQMMGMAFKRNDKFYDIFNEKFKQLFTASLINRYADNEYSSISLNPKNYRRFQPEDGPKVLTMQHLEAGFVIWIVSILVTILVFALEWTIRLKDYILFRYILASFFGVEYKNFVQRQQLKVKIMKAK